VAQRLPNNYGLYDMMGNVGEWIFDSFVDWGVYAEGIDNYIVNDYNGKKNNGMDIRSGVWGYICLSDNDLSITQTTSTLGFRIVKAIFENNP
jgi:formylglycine-generating enzyme required for sulfatase activity